MDYTDIQAMYRHHMCHNHEMAWFSLKTQCNSKSKCFVDFVTGRNQVPDSP